MRYSLPDSGSVLVGWPTYTPPVKDPDGRSGVSIVVVPTWEVVGHSTLPVVPNCWSVHACSPPAAAGLRVIPSGSVTRASLSIEESRPAGSVFWGTSTLMETPSGASDWGSEGVTLMVGLNGISLQPLAPTGVVNASLSCWPS